MLKIRRAQLHALVEARATTFNRQVVELISRQSPEQTSNLPPGYLDSLVAYCTRTCCDAGLSREGTIIEFAESMLKDAEHPMNQAQMSRKAQSILGDLRSRSLYEQLQAVNAAAKVRATASSATAVRADATGE